MARKNVEFLMFDVGFTKDGKPRHECGAVCEGLNVRKKSYYELSLRRQCCGVIGILGWVEGRAGF